MEFTYIGNDNALHDAHSWAKSLATGFGVPCRLIITNREKDLVHAGLAYR